MTNPKAPKDPMTAAELSRLKAEMLRSDPDYKKRVDLAETERQQRVQKEAKAAEPIIADLAAAGFQVESVWDLGNRATSWDEALPILLAHLERGTYPERIMESLGRMLAAKSSIVYWDRLRALYLNSRSDGEREGLASALAACATKEKIETLFSFVAQQELGETRIYFLRPIKRLGGEQGRQLLETLRNDPMLGKEASSLLKNYKTKR